MITTTQLPSVAQAVAQAPKLDGMPVTLTGTFIQDVTGGKLGPAVLADRTNVVTSFAPSVVDASKSVELSGSARDDVRGYLPRQGFSAGLDVRTGPLLVQGTLRAGSPVRIDVASAVIAPSAPTPDYGSGGFGFAA